MNLLSISRGYFFLFVLTLISVLTYHHVATYSMHTVANFMGDYFHIHDFKTYPSSTALHDYGEILKKFDVRFSHTVV